MKAFLWMWLYSLPALYCLAVLGNPYWAEFSMFQVLVYLLLKGVKRG